MIPSTEGKTLREVSDMYLQEKHRIRRMEDELEMLRDHIVPATARLTAMPGRPSEPGDPTSAVIIRIEELEEEIAEAKKELDVLYMSLAYSIAYTVESEDDRSIVYHRLVLNEPYKAIASYAICSASHARNVVSRWGQEVTVA